MMLAPKLKSMNIVILKNAQRYERGEASVRQVTAKNKDMKQNMLLRRIKYLESYFEARESMNGGNFEQMAIICDGLVD